MIRKFHKTLPTAALLAALLPQAVCAQEDTGQTRDGQTDADDGLLDTIVVTAQRRSEALQEVPIAVSALNAERIREAGFSDVEDLTSTVPNLSVSALWGTSNPKIFMRGIGNNNFNQTAESKVAVYLDQVYLSAPSGQLFQMFDLDRIEVLRGPQGTLYGKNATGGAISVYSQLPDDEFEGYARAGYGNYDAIDLEAAVTIPMSETLSARVAGTWTKRDGYVLDLATGDYVNDADQWAARGILRWQPNAGVDIALNFHGGASDATNNNSVHRGIFDPAQLAMGNLVRLSAEEIIAREGVDALGYRDDNPDPYVNTYGNDTFGDIELFGISLVGDFEIGNTLLTSVTGYENSKRSVLQDGNGAPSTIFTINWGPSEFESISQEFRLASQNDGNFNWLVGVFGFHETGEVDNFYNLADISFALGGIEAFDQAYTQKTDTLAAFAQSTVGLTDRLNLTVGARINYEKRTIDHQSFATTEAGVSLLPGPLFDLDLSESWTEWSGRVALDYEITPDIMAFASVNRGFTSGGFNTGAFNDPLGAERVFDPETVVSYEAGVKSTLLGRRLRLNVTGFIYDYSNLQVFTFTPSGLQFIENASNARVEGVEVEVQSRPFDNLELGASVGLMSSEYRDFTRDLGGVTEDLSGNRLIGAPNSQFNVVGKYTVPVSAGDFWVRGDFTYTGNRYYDERELEEISSEGATTNLNASIGFTDIDERIELSLWARNLTNEVNIIDILDVGLFGYQNVWYNMPRTYGVSLEYRF
ncbi:TonB-dependent receptor [Aurantiacibacter zhengii]|uniref:TonB-dependent receptor n=1 Tax=Aurantiacibacter zhengii TaxID=2307003 RepID=A0A418NRV1_9SPHN|nr:TonB-dependent receptor [Aurantiacibacter zhengii]RIV85874.1 TonB-dependent receptor [Aurantiacibacter zhengii]